MVHGSWVTIHKGSFLKNSILGNFPILDRALSLLCPDPLSLSLLRCLTSPAIFFLLRPPQASPPVPKSSLFPPLPNPTRIIGHHHRKQPQQTRRQPHPLDSNLKGSARPHSGEPSAIGIRPNQCRTASDRRDESGGGWLLR